MAPAQRDQGTADIEAWTLVQSEAKWPSLFQIGRLSRLSFDEDPPPFPPCSPRRSESRRRQDGLTLFRIETGKNHPFFTVGDFVGGLLQNSG